MILKKDFNTDKKKRDKNSVIYREVNKHKYWCRAEKKLCYT